MASLTTTKTSYRGKLSSLGPCVGYEPAHGTPSVMRYKFTTDEKGATSISFKTSNCDLAHSTYGDDSAGDTIAKIRFSVTSQATGFENYVGSKGTLCGYSYGNYLKGEQDIDLLPNTDYYLWIYPNFKSYAVWNIGDCTIETAGQYGTPSTISAADGYLDQDIPITLTRGLDSMLHTVKVECCGKEEILAENSEEYPTFIWHPSLEKYAPLIAQASYAEATITVETFLNGNSLGESSKTIAVKIPENELLPQVNDGWVNASPYNIGAADGFTVYISGYSRAEISFDSSKIDMSGSMGASVKGFEISCGGIVVSASPYLTPILTAETNIVCSVIDSRDRRISKTIKVTPLQYSPPALTQISVIRCDANGNETDDGTYYKATATAIYSSLSGQNTYTMRSAYRTLQGSFGTGIAMSSGKPQIIQGTSPDASYEVRIELSDMLGNKTSITRKLPTRQWAMKFRENAQGVAFGKAPEFEKALELPEDWTVRRGLTDRAMWSSDIRTPNTTIPAAGWENKGSYAQQAVTVSGILSTDIVIADIMIYAMGLENKILANEEWSKVFYISATANTLTLYATSPLALDIPIKLVVIRK